MEKFDILRRVDYSDVNEVLFVIIIIYLFIFSLGCPLLGSIIFHPIPLEFAKFGGPRQDMKLINRLTDVMDSKMDSPRKLRAKICLSNRTRSSVDIFHHMRRHMNSLAL